MTASAVTADFSETRLARLDWLRQFERRAAISRVASVIAHLIGTPLHVIAGRAALIRSNPAPEAVQENARRIEAQVERLAARIRKLIDYLTSPVPDADPRTVDSLVEEALSMYAPIAAIQGIEIATAEPPEVVVDGNPALLVLTSLFSLAIRLGHAGTRVELSFAPRAEGGVVFDLSLPGITAPGTSFDHLDPPDDQVTDPELLQVLSVCNAIARQHGGVMRLAPDAANGMTIRFECPGISA
jgi:signal transduction histidine kinase